MTQQALAELTGISPHYIVDLERRSTVKKPSPGRLLRITAVLASPDQEMANEVARHWLHDQPTRAAGPPEARIPWHYLDRRLALALILAASGLKLDPFLPVEHVGLSDILAEQSQKHPGSEVWVVSDVLAEAISAEAAEQTSRNISERALTYRFFLPFGSKKQNWRAAKNALEAHLVDQKHVIQQQVYAYHIDACAFSCRLSVSAPGESSQRGFYSIGGTRKGARSFVEAPGPVVAVFVENLQALLDAAQANVVQHVPEYGSILQVFPENSK